jgi:CheY-like chemotaxis protein/DNA-binding XRE family transcriptional regulator
MPYTDVRKRFGLAIKRWRGGSGISQEELAWRAGLHRSYLADIERGARNVSLQSIDKLAKALNVSLSTLFKPLETTAELAAPPAHPAERAKAPVDILLVEDDPSDIESTLQAFRDARLTNVVKVVRDGAEALDYVLGRGKYARRKRIRRAEIILLDLSLPKVDGLEVLREIKANRRNTQFRVVVLTGSRRDEHLREALRLGAEGYLIKPIDFQRFTNITPKLDFSWTLQPQAESRCP